MAKPKGFLFTFINAQSEVYIVFNVYGTYNPLIYMTLMGNSMDFTIQGGKLICEGTIYARIQVSQKSIEELMEGMDDALGSLE